VEILKRTPDINHEFYEQLIRDFFESEDYAEGGCVFIEKRKPVFRGK
jgi:hypothetical protein